MQTETVAATRAELFVHLGHINLRSYHFCGMELVRHFSPAASSDLADPGVVHVTLLEDESRTNHFVRTDLQFFARMDLAAPVCMRIMCISDEPRHWLTKSLLQEVAVVPLLDPQGCNDVAIWAGSSAEEERRRRVTAAKAAKAAKAAAAKGHARTAPSAKRAAKSRSAPAPQRTRKRSQASAETETANTPVDNLLLGMLENEEELPDAAFYQSESGEESAEDADCEEEGLNLDENGGDAALDEGSPTESSWAASGSENDEAEDEAGPADTGRAEATAAAEDQELERVRAHVPEREPRVAAAQAIRAPRTAATVLDLGELGDLRFYPKSGVMSAFCRCENHRGGPDCRRSATCRPKGPGAGRPLGMLVAWLQRNSDFSSQMEHVHACHTTLAQRQAARRWLMQQPGSADFASFEKPARDGEDLEPVQA